MAAKVEVNCRLVLLALQILVVAVVAELVAERWLQEQAAQQILGSALLQQPLPKTAELVVLVL